MTTTRRQFVKTGLALALAPALVAASRLPTPAEAKALGHGGGCPMPFGPLHQYLYATGPDPDWQHAVILRESGWDQGAQNPYSSAAGLAQFLRSTFDWGCERFDIYGSPYDGYVSIALMNAFVAAGERYHWNCGPNVGCEDI